MDSSRKRTFPNKIRYEYKRDERCPMVFAHGVWGGLNPQGEIEMNLYTESDKLPAYAERIIHPDGSVGPEVNQGEADTKTIVRTVHAKVVFNHRTARAIIEWLEEKVRLLEMDHSPMTFTSEEDGPAQ